MRADTVRRGSLGGDSSALAQHAGADLQRIRFPVSQDRQVEHGREVVPNQLQDEGANEAQNKGGRQCRRGFDKFFLHTNVAIEVLHFEYPLPLMSLLYHISREKSTATIRPVRSK